MKEYLNWKIWLRLSMLTFILLLLIAPSCDVAGGPEIVCQGRMADLVTLRSLKVTIKNPAARSGAIGCITAAKLPTANTVSVNMHTGLGVKGRSLTTSMGNGNYSGAACFYRTGFKSNNFLKVHIPCNFGSTGIKVGTVDYGFSSPLGTWSIYVY